MNRYATRRDLVGRKIVDVDLQRFTTRDDEQGRDRFVHLGCITLDNGKRILLTVAETGSEYAIEPSVLPKVEKP